MRIVEYSHHQSDLVSEMNAPFHSIAATMDDFSSTSPIEYNKRIAELGETAFGGTSERRPLLEASSTESGGGSNTSSIVSSPSQIPDGPPPVMSPN